jgi:hypothetical protein
MSRSHKQPFITDSRHGRWKDKRFAAKAARNADLVGGNHYKKLYQSYHICDYAWYSPDYAEAYRK